MPIYYFAVIFIVVDGFILAVAVQYFWNRRRKRPAQGFPVITGSTYVTDSTPKKT
jgi:hypothetical protein